MISSQLGTDARLRLGRADFCSSGSSSTSAGCSGSMRPAHQIVIYFLSRFGLPQAVAALLALGLSFAVAAGLKGAFDALDRARVGRRGTAAVSESAAL